MKNTILVLGEAATNKRRLVQQITGNNDVNKNAITQKEEEVGGQIVEWRMRTKYYTAAVRIYIADIDNIEAATTAAATPTDKDNVEIHNEPSEVDVWADSLGSAVDALVLVWDSSRPSSLAAVQPWARFAAITDPAIALCIDTNIDNTNTEIEKSIAECALWCTENGLELICLSDKPPTPEEAVGLDRVVEALQANPWAGLIRLDPKKQPPPTNNHDPINARVNSSLQDPRLAALEFNDDPDEYDDLATVLMKEEKEGREQQQFGSNVGVTAGQFSIDDIMATLAMNDLGENGDVGDVEDMDDDEFSNFMSKALEKAALKEMLGSHNGGGYDEQETEGSARKVDTDLADIDQFDSEASTQNMKELRSALFGNVDDDDFFEKAVEQIKNLRESGSNLGDEKRREMAKNIALALLYDDE
ncbi:hypothetical protein HK100_008614 [Physocladia obscura]|uniref:Uncharacterized protein n=1 Tax=Physocladia obscura TaxID=109957 RepID=A0AAD5T511_9FUNG|nr:hypothetical protein HK100_008614 [Physocladia obscura]